MKKILLVLAALMIWLAPPVYSQEDPEQILELAFSNYNSVPSEIEYSKISTANWAGEPKDCVSWIRRAKSGENEIMFVLEPDKKMKPDGAIIFFSNGILPPVIFQVRRSIKYKSAGFDSEANRTELNYFDLARLGGENVNDLRLSIWKKKTYRDLDEEVKVISSIKAEPKNRQEGDYAFRVFHVGIFQEMVVLAAVGCYDDDSKLVKLRLNLEFERLEFEKFVIAREKIRHIISTQTGNATFIRVIGRDLGADFGEIDEDALKAGRIR